MAKTTDTKHLLFLDFESYWNPAEGYGLREQSVVEYVRSPLFKAHGLGWATLDSDGVASGIHWVTGSQIPNFCSQIAKEIGWPNVTLVGHNVKFDGFILRHVYECVPGSFIDTKGMSKAVLGKTAKSHHLATLAQHFGLEAKGVMKTEGLRDLTQQQENDLAEYCKHDVWLCRELFNRLSPQFPENQYAAMSRTVEMFVSPKLVLNVPLLQQTAEQEAKRRANIFKEIGIEKSVFASNAKFPKLLEERGFPVPYKPSPRKKDSEGKPVQIPALALGDPEFLELGETENEELKALVEARIAAKSTLLETRSAKLAKIGATGLWPFDIEFSGADQTHRFSGGSGAGGNPQNFTRGSALRRAVEAPIGCELVVGDFSNIELRLVAYLSKDPGLVQAIEKRVDIYCDFASVFYGRRITKDDKAERHFGKTAILGLGYGMGWEKFIKTVRVQTGQTITKEESRKAIDLYRTRYNRVPALWEKLDMQISAMMEDGQNEANRPYNFGHHCLYLPSGLTIKFPNLRQQAGDRGPEWVYDVWEKSNLQTKKLYGGKLLENIAQGLAGELCKEAMMKMEGQTGQVHDEIHVICKKGLGQVTAQKLKRVMSLSPAWLPAMQLDAEVGWGKTWADAK